MWVVQRLEPSKWRAAARALDSPCGAETRESCDRDGVPRGQVWASESLTSPEMLAVGGLDAEAAQRAALDDATWKEEPLWEVRNQA